MSEHAQLRRVHAGELHAEVGQNDFRAVGKGDHQIDVEGENLDAVAEVETKIDLGRVVRIDDG